MDMEVEDSISMVLLAGVGTYNSMMYDVLIVIVDCWIGNYLTKHKTTN